MVGRLHSSSYRTRSPSTDDDEEMKSLIIPEATVPAMIMKKKAPSRSPPHSEEFRSLLSDPDGRKSVPSSSSSVASMSSSTSGASGMRRRRTGAPRRQRKPPKSTSEQWADSFFGVGWNMTRVLKYCLMSAFMGVFTFWVVKRQHTQFEELEWEKHVALLQPGSNEQRCFKMKQDDQRCICPDPAAPLAKTDDEMWMKYHKALLDTAHQQRIAGTELDLVMIGDSAIERWNGTANLSTEQDDALKVPFHKYFTKKGGSRIEGLALGASGDTGPNILWSLRHGILKDLNPKVWFIYVGTADLFQSKCTNRFVIANILNVVKELHTKKPDAQFIIHGILPQLNPREAYNQKDRFLGSYWKRAQQVNAELKRFCNMANNLWYMQTARSFLAEQRESFGRKEVKMKLLKQGVDLTAEGLDVWGERIENKTMTIENTIEERKKAAKKLEDEGNT